MFEFITNEPNVIFESPTLRIIYIAHLLPTHPTARYRTRSIHLIDRVIWHHTGGAIADGLYGPKATARTCVYERKWPGIAYHFYIPYRNPRLDLAPEAEPITVYQCQPLKTWSYHTRSGWNSIGIGVVCQGCFYSRHNPNQKPYRGQNTEGPSDYQMVGTIELWQYLKTLLELTDADIYGHYHAGKVACPGDTLERFIEDTRSLPD